MTEYISRNEVIKILRQYGTEGGSSLGRNSGVVAVCEEEIRKLPYVIYPEITEELCSLLRNAAG